MPTETPTNPDLLQKDVSAIEQADPVTQGDPIETFFNNPDESQEKLLAYIHNLSLFRWSGGSTLEHMKLGTESVAQQLEQLLADNPFSTYDSPSKSIAEQLARLQVLGVDQHTLSTFAARIDDCLGEGFRIAAQDPLAFAEKFQSCLVSLGEVARVMRDLNIHYTYLDTLYSHFFREVLQICYQKAYEINQAVATELRETLAIQGMTPSELERILYSEDFVQLTPEQVNQQVRSAYTLELITLQHNRPDMTHPRNNVKSEYKPQRTTTYIEAVQKMTKYCLSTSNEYLYEEPYLRKRRAELKKICPEAGSKLRDEAYSSAISHWVRREMDEANLLALLHELREHQVACRSVFTETTVKNIPKLVRKIYSLEPSDYIFHHRSEDISHLCSTRFRPLKQELRRHHMFGYLRSQAAVLALAAIKSGHVQSDDAINELATFYHSIQHDIVLNLDLEASLTELPVAQDASEAQMVKWLESSYPNKKHYVRDFANPVNPCYEGVTYPNVGNESSAKSHPHTIKNLSEDGLPPRENVYSSQHRAYEIENLLGLAPDEQFHFRSTVEGQRYEHLHYRKQADRALHKMVGVQIQSESITGNFPQVQLASPEAVKASPNTLQKIDTLRWYIELGKIPAASIDLLPYYHSLLPDTDERHGGAAQSSAEREALRNEWRHIVTGIQGISSINKAGSAVKLDYVDCFFFLAAQILRQPHQFDSYASYSLFDERDISQHNAQVLSILMRLYRSIPQEQLDVYDWWLTDALQKVQDVAFRQYATFISSMNGQPAPEFLDSITAGAVRLSTHHENPLTIHQTYSLTESENLHISGALAWLESTDMPPENFGVHFRNSHVFFADEDVISSKPTATPPISSTFFNSRHPILVRGRSAPHLQTYALALSALRAKMYPDSISPLEPLSLIGVPDTPQAKSQTDSDPTELMRIEADRAFLDASRPQLDINELTGPETAARIQAEIVKDPSSGTIARIDEVVRLLETALGLDENSKAKNLVDLILIAAAVQSGSLSLTDLDSEELKELAADARNGQFWTDHMSESSQALLGQLLTGQLRNENILLFLFESIPAASFMIYLQSIDYVARAFETTNAYKMSAALGRKPKFLLYEGRDKLKKIRERNRVKHGAEYDSTLDPEYQKEAWRWLQKAIQQIGRLVIYDASASNLRKTIAWLLHRMNTDTLHGEAMPPLVARCNVQGDLAVAIATLLDQNLHVAHGSTPDTRADPQVTQDSTQQPEAILEQTKQGGFPHTHGFAVRVENTSGQPHPSGVIDLGFQVAAVFSHEPRVDDGAGRHLSNGRVLLGATPFDKVVTTCELPIHNNTLVDFGLEAGLTASAIHHAAPDYYRTLWSIIYQSTTSHDERSSAWLLLTTAYPELFFQNFEQDPVGERLDGICRDVEYAINDKQYAIALFILKGWQNIFHYSSKTHQFSGVEELYAQWFSRTFDSIVMQLAGYSPNALENHLSTWRHIIDQETHINILKRQQEPQDQELKRLRELRRKIEENKQVEDEQRRSQMLQALTDTLGIDTIALAEIPSGSAVIEAITNDSSCTPSILEALTENATQREQIARLLESNQQTALERASDYRTELNNAHRVNREEFLNETVRAAERETEKLLHEMTTRSFCIREEEQCMIDQTPLTDRKIGDQASYQDRVDRQNTHARKEQIGAGDIQIGGIQHQRVAQSQVNDLVARTLAGLKDGEIPMRAAQLQVIAAGAINQTQAIGEQLTNGSDALDVKAAVLDQQRVFEIALRANGVNQLPLTWAEVRGLVALGDEARALLKPVEGIDWSQQRNQFAQLLPQNYSKPLS